MGTFKSYPGHLGKPEGKGYITCAMSGFLRKPSEVMETYKGTIVADDKADITPRFGTRHPQDVNQAEVGSDPNPIHPQSTADTTERSKQDLGISDAEILAAIVENRPPRRGF